MKRYKRFLNFLLISITAVSCSKDPEYVAGIDGPQPCQRWQVEYLDRYKGLSTSLGDDGLTITADLLGKSNTGSEVQYAIVPIAEDGTVAKLTGNFTAELQFKDFISTPDGATFEVIIGGHTGNAFSFDGLYAGSVGSSPNDNEGFGVYNNYNGYLPINTFNSSNKFLDVSTKNISGVFMFKREGDSLYISVKSGYGEVKDTVSIKTADLDIYFQIGTNSSEDVTTSITLQRFTISGFTNTNSGGGYGEPSNAVRSDNFDCYSIRLNK